MKRPWLSFIRVAVASLALTWLATPSFSRAASFNQIFTGLDSPNAATSAHPNKQTYINVLFNNRVYIWMLYGISMAGLFSLLYGGYLYINSQGKADQAEKGKLAIVYAIMGLVVLAISVYVINAGANLGAGVANNSVEETF